ncbi:hypothetical protein M422DRAFT_233351 [Sphaerobolus stellatus SS14]|uniref:Cytochrome P450 n=1 Tax=Sphaerobolus stellatus (strain SS14) TaxID=990650 RepID=A0A0C9UZC9_SPHS4|nr:hypothetical protein M422DRAFT_233351 [Sphaerobolus stellatus SS14]
MPLAITPGVRFLATAVPKLVIPPLFVHTVLRCFGPALYPSFQLSRGLVACIWLFTLPIWLFICAQYVHLARLHEAKRLGAELIPQVKGKYPGNIDLLWSNFFRKDLYLGDGFARSIDSHGTIFANNVLGDYRVITIEPQHVKQILTFDFNKFEKGPMFNKIAVSVLGGGVFNSDGERWQFHRKLTRPFFVKERIADFGIFDTKSSIALQKMQERFDQGHAIDFQDLVSRFTIDSACEFLFGTPIYSLHDPLPRPGYESESEEVDTPSNHFTRAFANAQTTIATRGRLGNIWPLFEILKDRTADDMKVVRDFIEPIVQDAMDKRKKGEVVNEHTLLHHLLDASEDMKLIVDEIINIMLAGRDTTAGLLTFVAYCLATNPDVLLRLREEILSTIGASRAPTFEDVRTMKYLRAVINETLRLFPSVPFNSRNTNQATTLDGKDGKKLFIPAGTRVAYSNLLCQRHKPYWGEDADIFDPDRFLDERVKKYLTPNPFIFVPFNAGPRIVSVTF